MTLAFLDTETTGLDPARHEIWEIGVIVRGHRDPACDGEWRWLIAPQRLADADPTGLRIGRFYERFDRYVTEACEWGPGSPGATWQRGRGDVAATLARLLDGAHMVGAVPSFDAKFLDVFLREHGQVFTAHHHLIDVEALAVGYLCGRDWRSYTPTLPWRSDDLTRACGVEPADDNERHTALGDARWAMRLYDAITGTATTTTEGP